MILKDKTTVLGFIISVFLFSFSSTVLAGPDWSIEGEYFEGCTCNPGCPCMFGSEPTYNKTCKISGVFHIKKGNYGIYSLDATTVIGITDLTAKADSNWVVFYIDSKIHSGSQRKALLDIFQNHVYNFVRPPSERVTVKYVPIKIESSLWHKRAVVTDNLTLDVEILRGEGDTNKPTQIVNKFFPIWSKEFDTTLDMGKAVTHRFHEGIQEWNYDGRSGFATTFHFSSNK
ncbi:MAG: DUF1326 domain-containing protein [Candidatus Brocadiaceae bacterium]|nr:DUF1326 domain-containing protein [Candidatus Brocadiaceae bacterium]